MLLSIFFFIVSILFAFFLVISMPAKQSNYYKKTTWFMIKE